MEINKIYQGNCLEVLKTFPDNSVDSIITDPPYHLVSIVKRFGKENSAPAKFGTDGAFSRASKGFMGKDWDGVNEDGIGIAQKVELWKECLRVLKPGGHLLAFSGTRTYHRMVSAIEDAGFEIRDMIEWVYGSGFPKSLNIGKAVDKIQGNERESFVRTDGKGTDSGSGCYNMNSGTDTMKKEFVDTKGTSEWEGWGTALKPAHEPICMARKPLAEKTVAENCLKYGTGGINIDESRVGTEGGTKHEEGEKEYENEIYGKGLYKDFGKVIPNLGRFPANLIHDGSEEVSKEFPNVKTGSITKDIDGRSSNSLGTFKVFTGRHNGDNGSASRFFKQCEFTEEDFEYSPFFYCAKASKSERNKGCEELEEKVGIRTNAPRENEDIKTPTRTNNHPTVKPIALMEYLIKMVTPKGGIVLDPFAGSGTTGVACKNLNRNYILIEKEPEYVEIANERIKQQLTTKEEAER
jgi:site-specific DNA-methyltransferase (adenine-specific)